MSGITTYDVGDVARISAIFTQAAVFVDPTAVTLTIKTPDAVLATYTLVTANPIVRDSLGHFHVDLPITQVGRHWYRWVSTGTGAATQEAPFEVRRTVTA